MQDTPGAALEARREHAAAGAASHGEQAGRREHSCRAERDPLPPSAAHHRRPAAQTLPSTLPPGQQAGLTFRDVSDLNRKGEKEKGGGWGQGRGVMVDVCSGAKRGDLVTVGKNGCFIAGSL